MGVGEYPAIGFVASTGSTNDDVKELGRTGEPHGTCVAAREQTEGRGRRGHVWRSPEGGLYLSVLLRPDVPMSLFVGLPAVCAMGIVDALRAAGAADAQIKWPNDAVCASGKLAGMLVEAGYSDEGPFAVCGIGINLERPADAGADTADGSVQPLEAAYLAEVLTESAELPPFEELAVAIWEAVLARVDAWCVEAQAGRANAGPLAPILSEYFDMVAGLGKQVRVLTPEGMVVMEGRFAGIDTWGKVTVVDEQGGEHEYSSEQVSLRGLA